MYARSVALCARLVKVYAQDAFVMPRIRSPIGVMTIAIAGRPIAMMSKPILVIYFTSLILEFLLHL